MSIAEPLKLIALDAEDLAVVSAHVQDAVVKVGDILFRPKDRCFALAMNRFDWQAAAEGGSRDYRRHRSLLRFERVLSAQVSRIDRSRSDAVLELLAVGFEPGEEPAGAILLHFAGGGTIRLAVECIEAQLTDLGAVWSTRTCPTHDLADQDSSENEKDAARG